MSKPSLGISWFRTRKVAEWLCVGHPRPIRRTKAHKPKTFRAPYIAPLEFAASIEPSLVVIQLETHGVIVLDCRTYAPRCFLSRRDKNHRIDLIDAAPATTLLITFLAHPTVIFPASNVRTTTGRVPTRELRQIRRTVLLENRRPFRFKIRSITFLCFSFFLLFFSLIRIDQYRIPFVFFFCTVGRPSRVAIVTWRSFKCNGESRHAVVTRESRKTAARERHRVEFVWARFLVYICYVLSALFLLVCCGLGIRSLSRLRAYACPPYALTRVPFTSPVSPF